MGYNNMNESTSHLEPRVARLETGLESLTKAVNDIATTIRDNNNSTNIKIDALAVGLANAAAPKKTDWGLFIAGIGLILALGAAVLVPLNNSTQDNKQSIEKYHEAMVEHMKLPLHPVGQARIDGMEKAIDLTRGELIARDTALDTKIQRETQLMTDLISAKLIDLDSRIQKEFIGLNTALDLRVGKVEEFVKHESFADQDELRRWRLGELKR